MKKVFLIPMLALGANSPTGHYAGSGSPAGEDQRAGRQCQGRDGDACGSVGSAGRGGRVTKNDKRYQDVRMTAQASMKYAEGTAITTAGWVHLVAGETDGDYHIQIGASATSGDQCLIVEVPNPDPQ
jgi:hypothetical protein